jgi:hypothetical protein
MRGLLFPAPEVLTVDGGIPSETNPDPMGLGDEESTLAGSAWNFARQLAPQKKYFRPSC